MNRVHSAIVLLRPFEYIRSMYLKVLLVSVQSILVSKFQTTTARVSAYSVKVGSI